jgi:hypothetical protein
MKWIEGWETEDKKCEDTEVETDDRNGEHRLVKLNNG